jgi:glycosyltransferase involved in cell wall biosynthesis
MPVASVVIPAYNREGTIARAIDSVLNQTKPDLEVMVVDDGSSDDTVAIIENYEDDRVQCRVFSENRGANAARNAGIRQATGEYVTFLDSDDEYDPVFIETVSEALNDAPMRVGGVYTSRRQVRNSEEVDLNIADTVYREPKQVACDYQAYGFSNWAFRRDVFDDVGDLDASLRGLQDREFMFRFLREYEFHPIKDVLVTQHQHAKQMSTDPERKLTALDQVVEKHNELFDETTRAWIDYHRGWLYARGGDLRTGRRYFWSALRRQPKARKIQLQAVASLLGQRGFRTVNELKQRAKHAVLKYL